MNSREEEAMSVVCKRNPLSTISKSSQFKQKVKFFQQLIDQKTDEILFHDITVGKQLGRGGFGTVYQCFISKKMYALKKFHVQSRNQRAADESFQSERLATMLNHKNIVRSFCTFIQQESFFVLMEYVSTKTLQAIIDDPMETLSLSRRVKFAGQIASGLAYAHSRRIVHLDLKPLNILVTNTTDQCKIADFGCCKDISESSSPTTPTKSSLTGTYSYRAPELLRGEPATEKADIYSLGICLWQMVARQRPYGNENHQVIIFKVVAYNLRPVIPENTETKYTDIMTKCWDSCKDRRETARDIYKYFSDEQSFSVES